MLAKASAAAEAADADAFGTAAAELHVTLIQRGGNETLSVLSQLLNQLILERYKIGAHKSDQALLRRAARSYQRLYGFIEAGDAAKAATHWEKQMQWVSASTGKGELLDVFDEKLLKSAF